MRIKTKFNFKEVLTSVCSCLVVGKNVSAAFAKSSSESSPIVIAYEKGDPAWAEFELDAEALKDVPCHELTQDLVDDFDYSKVRVDEYALGDESFVAPAISADDEIHVLQEDRGNYIPTSYWNLANSAYHYSIIIRSLVIFLLIIFSAFRRNI